MRFWYLQGLPDKLPEIVPGRILEDTEPEFRNDGQNVIEYVGLDILVFHKVAAAAHRLGNAARCGNMIFFNQKHIVQTDAVIYSPSQAHRFLFCKTEFGSCFPGIQGGIKLSTVNNSPFKSELLVFNT